MNVRPRPGAFLDRDGTLIEDAHHLGDPVRARLLPGAAESVAALVEAGYVVVVVTNQSGVARGLFDAAAVEAVNRRVAELLVARDPRARVTGFYYCPHLDGCNCRKPLPGLLLRAAREHRLDLRRSVAIGDSVRDVDAARSAGCSMAVQLGAEYPTLADATNRLLDRRRSVLSAPWMVESLEHRRGVDGEWGSAGTGCFSSAAPGLGEKLVERGAIPDLRRAASRLGQKVVFTNGCFDLLHVGHLHLLQAARARGDRLVVAVNNDASVRRLKGPARPVVCEADRAAMLCALEVVDHVTLFDEDTPLEVILALRPDVLVKGGDYRRDDVVGAIEVESWGGEVLIVPTVAGRSTTRLLDILKRRDGHDD